MPPTLARTERRSKRERAEKDDVEQRAGAEIDRVGPQADEEVVNH